MQVTVERTERNRQETENHRVRAVRRAEHRETPREQEARRQALIRTEAEHPDLMDRIQAAVTAPAEARVARDVTEEETTVTEGILTEEAETVSITVQTERADVRQDRVKETEARVHRAMATEAVPVLEAVRAARRVTDSVALREEEITASEAVRTVHRAVARAVVKAEEETTVSVVARTVPREALRAVRDREEAVLPIPYSLRR